MFYHSSKFKTNVFFYLFIFSGPPVVFTFGELLKFWQSFPLFQYSANIIWNCQKLKTILQVSSHDNLTIIPRTIFLKNPAELIPSQRRHVITLYYKPSKNAIISSKTLLSQEDNKTSGFQQIFTSAKKIFFAIK